MTQHNLVTGELRQADATRREPTRVPPVAPQETGLHGRGGGSTTQRDMVRASLLLADDRAVRHGVYPRRVPGSPRHA
jgi:hypothetical protein